MKDGADGMSKSVLTVLGPLPAEQMGITDAHNHIWIEAVAGCAPGAPVLVNREAVLTELKQYRSAGGGAVIDCQPGGCGRNAVILAELSEVSEVVVVACTGYHRQRYYAPEHELWKLDANHCAELFIREVTEGAAETLSLLRCVRAGFVKAALEVSLAQTPARPLEGALMAAVETGAALLVHTEKGQAVEEFLTLCQCHKLPPQRLILCHVDKRPDFGLHRELAQAGVLLEYDTFFRPHYEPDTHVWPLIERMTAAGLDGSLALATDMAEAALWRFSGGPRSPGLPGFIESIHVRLEKNGLSAPAIAKMTGQNIAERLAFSHS